ncbi:hypothetical protein GQ54DRAFT_310652 [Martensiomyces pterosporus]|nr:hypothetical protein GQ54DRAFT_310652 [Martensiomyces pterosporus]
MAGEVVSGLVKGLSAAVRDVIESSVRREVAAAFKMAIPQLHTSSGAAMSPPPSNGRASGAYQVEYRQVTQKDWDEVKAAMPGIHWRQCPNKHWYAVGECGNPIATGYCIECKTTLR